MTGSRRPAIPRSAPAPRRLPGDWYPGAIPDNVELDPTTYIESSYSFRHFRGRRPAAVRLGRGTSVYLGAMFDVGPEGRVTVGDYVLMNSGQIVCDSELRIGDHSLISWNVVLMDNGRLPSSARARHAELRRLSKSQPRRLCRPADPRPILIGRCVWIGFDCCILPGVRIGDGAVVGARSVVADDVPAWAVVAGNPAKVVRYLAPLSKAPTAVAQTEEGGR